MGIKKAELEKMNEMLEKGSTFAQIQRKFEKYDYWEIYWETNDYSFLGKKRMITNRINKIAKSKSPSERREIAKETKEYLDELYSQLKINSKKLIEIDRVLRK
jgi:hypothetical protein